MPSSLPGPLLLLLLLLSAQHSAIHVTTESSRYCRLEQLPQQVRMITCSGSEVTEVPTVDASLNAKIFYMDSCPIAYIGPDSFANLTDSLTFLSIRTTVPIANLSGQAFRNLHLLTELMVVASAMQPTAVKAEQLLSTLSSLTFLHLENVKLGHLPNDFVSGTKLSIVRLINADIVSIESSAFTSLSSLRVIELCKNPASTYMTSLLRQIGTVENLTMTNCGLTTIVNPNSSFSRLTLMNFANNQLTLLDLRSFASAAKTLKVLELNGNKLGADGLPGLGSMSALQRLFLNSNPMKEMPNNIGQLESLELLEARKTLVSNIRVGDFHERSRLYSLKLDDAQINFIEVTAFQRLGRLAELSLTIPASRVLVRSVTDPQQASWSEVLTKLPALRNLTLSGQGAEMRSGLDDTVWPGLVGNQQLRRLLLDYNVITNVPDFQFAWSRLDLLSLRNNKIVELNSASLYGLAPNAIVQLQDNSLSSLDNCTLAGLTSLSKIGLAGNPWRCDCALVWLLNRMRAEAGNDALTGVLCNQPLNLRGRAWSDLTGADFCPSGAPIPASCKMREPPSTPAPTPTAFPYPLDIRLAMELSDELLVRLTINASGLASRFDRYIVRYGPEADYQLRNSVQEALISVNSLVFHVDTLQRHRFCVILQGPTSGDVESPTNCRVFMPSRAEQQQLSPAHISIAVIVPVVALALIALLVCCLLQRRARRDEVKTGAAGMDDYNSYTYLDTEDPNSRGARFQSARKPESRRFTKRNGSTTLNGSRPSLNASASNLQQQLQQMQQVNQIQQMQLHQMQRIHSMSQSAMRQSASDPFSTSLPIDPRGAMRSAQSTDALTSMLATGPAAGGAAAAAAATAELAARSSVLAITRCYSAAGPASPSTRPALLTTFRRRCRRGTRRCSRPNRRNSRRSTRRWTYSLDRILI
ncbi:hypothetical protein BOX15_Mlig015930g2 [Macrostomum lignano]|uniref:LRRCT domain-containing protein n=1 Tax=Macrostomum lignano TaxID=282301 RepID=A0A267F4L1_9PLAT|nr:hypothetical protein BOX15_Mlig015930g2 [Macrostomum lignano]